MHLQIRMNALFEVLGPYAYQIAYILFRPVAGLAEYRTEVEMRVAFILALCEA